MYALRLIALLLVSLPAAAAAQPPALPPQSAEMNRAEALVSHGNYGAAEPIVRGELEQLERTLGADDPRTLVDAYKLGIVLSRQDRLGEAESVLQRAVAGLERAVGRDHYYTLLALDSLARVYVLEGRSVEVEPIVVRLMEATERTLGPDDVLTLQQVSNLAVLRVDAGRLAEAEPMFVRILAARERLFGQDNPETLNAMGNLADLMDRLGRPAEAEALFRRAYDVARAAFGPTQRLTLNATYGLGKHYWGQRRFAEAEPLLENTAAGYMQLYGDSHLLTISTAELLAMTRLAMGRANAYGAAQVAMDGIRKRQHVESDTQYAAEQVAREREGLADAYRLFADTAYVSMRQDQAQSGNQGDRLAAEAFVALQESMTTAAGDAIVRRAARRRAERSEPGLDALIRERDAVAGQWSTNAADYSAALGGTDARAEALRAQLAAEQPEIEARLRALDARLQGEYPRYGAMVRPGPLEMREAWALLRPDEALLMIVPNGYGTQIFAVTHTDTRWVRSAATQAQINDAARRLLWDAGAPVPASAEEQARWEAASRGGRAFDRTTAYQLYQQLVGPMADLLAGKRHVFVVATGRLAELPLGVLVAEPPTGDDADPAALRATAWLADRYALIQLPSLQSLQFQRRFVRPRGGAIRGSGFVGFGDPLLQGTAVARGRNGTVTTARDLRRLARLPGTAVELERMRAAVGAPESALYLRERATEQRLRTMDLSGVRILALATHGLTAGELQSAPEPGLVLTPPASPSEADDGYLSASEVAGLSLDADWVILSACNTAAGQSDDAPGLSGLARAFFYAGARTLLASHWPVRDDVAPVLTVRILELQRANPALSRAEAFQRAMREIRQQTDHDAAGESWAHPNAWAPFTLIGDGAS